MLWVLHEAIHDLELKALKQSHVIALSQDLQGNKMSLRYSCVSGKELLVTGGLIGFKTTKLGALEEAKTTKGLVQKFVLRRVKPPEGWTGPTNLLDESDLQMFRTKVESLLRLVSLKFFIVIISLALSLSSHCQPSPQEIFTTDAAADELKVARILSGHTHGGEDPYFRNLVVRLRDRCHAVSRPGFSLNYKWQWFSKSVMLVLHQFLKL